jgi:hypothetical protein
MQMLSIVRNSQSKENVRQKHSVDPVTGVETDELVPVFAICAQRKDEM